AGSRAAGDQGGRHLQDNRGRGKSARGATDAPAERRIVPPLRASLRGNRRCLPAVPCRRAWASVRDATAGKCALAAGTGRLRRYRDGPASFLIVRLIVMKRRFIGQPIPRSLTPRRMSARDE